MHALVGMTTCAILLLESKDDTCLFVPVDGDLFDLWQLLVVPRIQDRKSRPFLVNLRSATDDGICLHRFMVHKRLPGSRRKISFILFRRAKLFI